MTNIASVRIAVYSVFFLLLCSNVSSNAQSIRPGTGAIPYTDGGGNGVTFRTWAPNATAVGVKGQFNGWGSTLLVSEGTGWWSIDIAGAQAGQEYKYRLNNNADKRDPRSRRVSNSAGNSIVYDRNAFDWQGQSFNTPQINELVIYEMHAGTFNAESWIPSTLDKNIEKLDYLKDLGINAIELMPVNEFAADKSWGYNPADIFAIESALGGPDALKRFVKACHDRGIAVLIDVVHNHYGPSDLSLWQFDGWSENGLGGIYFYNDPNMAYTWWGDTRPDFGRPEVRDFIRDQIFMFLEEYHVDGFRWDSVFNMLWYNGGANFIDDSRQLLQDINWEVKQNFPGTIIIAEDHAFDFSMNFDAVWEVSFHEHIKWQVTRVNDADRNVNWLGDKIAEWPSHQRVIFSESHDEVGDLNSKHRLPYEIDSGDPSSIWARKRQLLAAAVVLTSPGIPMLFQGQEMNEDLQFSDARSLRWGLTNFHSGIVNAYGDLIKLRRNKFGTTPGLKGTGVNVNHRDDVNKVMGMVRWDAGGGSDDVVVIMNLAATVHNSGSYFFEFPSEGTWYVHYNSDANIYGGDFGNIGQTQVTASSSPAMAAVNMGSYATIVLSKTPRPPTGIVSLDPAIPDGCVPVEISYQPNGGSLNSATNIHVVVGYNGFQFPLDVPMTNQAGTWVTTFQIPVGAGQINMAFNDGEASPIWDSNFGDNWGFNVNNCANLPATVSVNPVQPQGCDPVSVTYAENAGPLMNESNVVLYIGRNGWQDIQSINLIESSPGIWTNDYQMETDTWQLDFVFNNGAATGKIWDNNNLQDWLLLIVDCIDSETPGVFITNPVTSITVSNSVTNIMIAGYSSLNLIGQLLWSNTLTGTKNWVPAGGFPWTVPYLSLGEGANVFRISGLSDTINPNDGAEDDTGNPPYVGTEQWNNGDDGGTKWGGGWQLSGGGNTDHIYANTNAGNLDLGEHAWQMTAHSSETADAIRPLKNPLAVGDTFTVDFENNWIQGGGVIGMGFHNRFGQILFQYIFSGGGTNYVILDNAGSRQTGIQWANQPQALSFQLTSPNVYLFKADGQSFTGTLSIASETVIDRFRIFNFNAGNGDEYNLYFDNMSITGAPLESLTYQAEVSITRSFGPNSDPDGDQFATWEESIAGTNPFDGLSRLPNVGTPAGVGIMSVDVGQSVAGRWYDIYTSSNLMKGIWSKSGLSKPGTGGGIILTFTNYNPELFYRTGVSTTP